MIVHLSRVSKYFVDNWHKHVFTHDNHYFFVTSKRVLKEGFDYEIDLSKATDLSTTDPFFPKERFYQIDDIRTIAKIKKSYIKFKEIPTKKKTKTFEVISKTDGSKLGEIKWHPNYRSYALFVTHEIMFPFAEEYYKMNVYIFDIKCQKEITAFCEKLMEERKNDTKKTAVHTGSIQKQ